MDVRKLIVALIGSFFMLSVTIAHADQTPVMPKKKWTFMIFLNGNNNLDHYGERNIIDMEKIGSNDEVNIVVQWASYHQRKVTRLYIQKSNDHSRVTSPAIQDLGRVDMGSYKSLEDFVQWTVEHYPADHYFIDVWDHGSGWQKKRLATNRDISWDELTGNRIKTEELGLVMAHVAAIMGHKVDIYGSDACLMAMAEVANEMSDSVQYFVGSQEVEPAEGWPYGALLAKWEATPNATPEQVAKMLVSEYVKAYEPGGSYPSRSVTLSAYRLDKLPALNEAIRKLGVSLRQIPPSARELIVSRFREVQIFEVEDYADLIDLMTVLSSSGQQMLNQEEIHNVIMAAKDMIIANKTTIDYSRATGLSIWLPVTHYDFSYYAARYKHLHFSANSDWDQTLDALLQGASSQQQDQQQLN